MKARKLLTIALLSLPVLLITIILVAVSATNLVHKLGSGNFDTPLIQARQLMEQKDYYSARDIYLNILQSDPGNITAMLELCDYYESRQDYTQAISLLQQETSQNNHLVFTRLAIDEYAKGNNGLALQAVTTALSLDPQDEDAIILAVKLASINLDKNTISTIITADYFKQLGTNTRFIAEVAATGMGMDRTQDLRQLDPKLNNSQQQLVALMLKNYPDFNSTDTSKVIEAKANVVYALITDEYYELANPPAQDLITLNKFYENSLLYRSIIYLHCNNYAGAAADLDTAAKYYPKDISVTVLKLQVALATQDSKTETGLVNTLISKFTAKDSDKYFEAFKSLYKYHQYLQFHDLFFQTGTQMTDHVVEVDFLALKTFSYLKDYTVLPQLLKTLENNVSLLNSEQHADLLATEALVSANSGNSDNALQLLKNADSLYFYSPFVQYIKSVINNDSQILARAYELDLDSEIPK